MTRKLMWQYTGLTALALVFIIFYLTFKTYGNWGFALQLRGKRVLIFLLVALATSGSTIAFQTLTKNQFLTPSILGLDNLYVLIQTLMFFCVGGITMLSQETTLVFLFSILLMAFLSTTLVYFFMDKTSGELFLLLMVGMVLGTLFASISTFLQVLMDPNEYDLLQGKLFASFSHVNSHHLVVATGIILIAVAVLWYLIPELDVLHLGMDPAKNLGVSLNLIQKSALLAISTLTGTATALVGPTTFLGFIVATISYQVFATYRHRTLFVGSFLIGVVLLVGGQFLVEQVFTWNTTISTVVQFAGGIFFIGKIIVERKK